MRGGFCATFDDTRARCALDRASSSAAHGTKNSLGPRRRGALRNAAHSIVEAPLLLVVNVPQGLGLNLNSLNLGVCLGDLMAAFFTSRQHLRDLSLHVLQLCLEISRRNRSAMLRGGRYHCLGRQLPHLLYQLVLLPLARCDELLPLGLATSEAVQLPLLHI